MPKTKAQLKPGTPEYEQFAKNLVAIYETGYLDKKAAYKQTFIKGVIGGVGGVIGATLVIAIIIWALSLFHEVPLIGPFTSKVQHSIQSKDQ